MTRETRANIQDNEKLRLKVDSSGRYQLTIEGDIGDDVEIECEGDLTLIVKGKIGDNCKIRGVNELTITLRQMSDRGHNFWDDAKKVTFNIGGVHREGPGCVAMNTDSSDPSDSSEEDIIRSILREQGLLRGEKSRGNAFSEQPRHAQPARFFQGQDFHQGERFQGYPTSSARTRYPEQPRPAQPAPQGQESLTKTVDIAMGGASSEGKNSTSAVIHADSLRPGELARILRGEEDISSILQGQEPLRSEKSQANSEGSSSDHQRRPKKTVTIMNSAAHASGTGSRSFYLGAPPGGTTVSRLADGSIVRETRGGAYSEGKDSTSVNIITRR